MYARDKTLRMNNNSRTINTARNIFWGQIGTVANILLGFASRTVFIYTIGISYLGINGLFASILGVLSFAELGIGNAMNFSLYKPMANDNREKLKSLMFLFCRAYRFIAGIIAIFGLALLPFLNYIIKDAEGIQHIHVYYVIFLFNTVSSYFITYKFSIIKAAQKEYILTNINTVTHSFILILQIIVLVVFKSFLAYLLVQSIFQLVQKILTSIYIDRKYTYLSEKRFSPLEETETKRIKTDVKALILHKLGDISVHQTDNIIISAFISLTMVGLVSNYTLLMGGISMFIAVIFNSFSASLGNLIATESKEKQMKIFNAYTFMGFWIYGLTTICFIVLVQPFIALWIGEDKQIDNISMLLIMSNFFFLGYRLTMVKFKIAGGIFKQDRFIALVQAAVNLIISLILVRLIGLPGIYIGTVIQGLIANIWRPIIVYREIFTSSSKKYFINCFKQLAIVVIIAIILSGLSVFILTPITIVRFILMIIITGIAVNLVFYIIFRKNEEFTYIISQLTGLWKGLKKYV